MYASASERMLAAEPTNGSIEMVDLKNGKALRSLEGERPAAARFAPEFNQLYATRGQTVYVYDGTSSGGWRRTKAL